MNTKAATKSASSSVVESKDGPRLSLLQKFAAGAGIDPKVLSKTLKTTVFKIPKSGQHAEREATDEELVALLVIADQFNLDVWTGELKAFPDGRGGITPMVTIDGWITIVNRHPNFRGAEFFYSDETIEVGTGQGNDKGFGHEWMECEIEVKGRSKPTRIREYLAELYQPPRGQNAYAGPWQKNTRRMHRHKTFIQCARYALGLHGIRDEDEAREIFEHNAGAIIEGEATRGNADDDFTQTVRGNTPKTAREKAPDGASQGDEGNGDGGSSDDPMTAQRAMHDASAADSLEVLDLVVDVAKDCTWFADDEYRKAFDRAVAASRKRLTK